jgi:hypothetical protein
MSTVDVYSDVSTIVDRATVEHNVLTHLQTWIETYIAAIERFHQLPARTLPLPKSWRIEKEFARNPQDTMPFVAVVSTGLSPGKPPKRDGDGTVRAWWIIAVGAVVAAGTEQDAKDLSGYYGAALRMIMLQMPELGGWASDVEWNDEKYDDWPSILEQMISSARLVFTVEVEDVINVFEGFRGPDGVLTVPSDPYAYPLGYPDTEQVVIDLELNK